VLRANASVKAGSLTTYDLNASDETDVYTAVRPIIALGDAHFEISAGKDLEIETIYNPTYSKQSNANVNSADLNPNLSAFAFDDKSISSVNTKATYSQFSAFSTYSDQSGVSLTAMGGDMLLSNNTLLVLGVGGPGLTHEGVWRPYAAMLAYAPPTLEAAALSGSLVSQGGFALASAASGQLALLANESITLNNQSGVFSRVVMLDNDPATVSTPAHPTLLRTADLSIIRGEVTGLAAHTYGNLHSDDSAPVLVVAKEGSISGASGSEATLMLPKRADIEAGLDIRDLGFTIQHSNAADDTLVIAGRDFVDSTNVEEAGVVKHVVTGPGQLTLLAGRDIDLGNGQGVVTRGNLDNPYLPSGGASVMAVSGATISADEAAANPFDALKSRTDFFDALVLASKYESFAKANESSNGGPSDVELASFDLELTKTFPNTFNVIGKLPTEAAVQGASVAHLFVKQFNQAILDALATDVQGVVPSSAKLTNLAFDLAMIQRYPAMFADTSLPSDLLSPDSHPHLGAFDALISKAFGSSQAGDIKVFGSQFKTEQGGSLDLMAPGGSIIAGLTSVPAYLNSKPASEVGIFTIRGGDIRALVKNDFLVNQGRVFTLGGGDITMVSQYGNIDAGRGTKTASSAPPPLLTTDASGNTKIDIAGSIAGSGIAALKTSDDQPVSNISATAPRGVFDAGDAGVRSTGSVSIQAGACLNCSNISAGGGIASSVSLGGIATASAAPAATSSAADEATKQMSVAPKETLALTVEVLGHGEEDDSDDDEEKRKRAKAKKS
jgi:filamentous hemagglutinin